MKHSLKMLVVLCLVILLGTGCISQSSTQHAGLSDDPSGTEPEVVQKEGMLTILMPRYSSVEQKARTEYAQQIVNDAGFSIRFEVYEEAPLNDQYLTQYYEEVESRKEEDLIFMLYGNAPSKPEWVQEAMVKPISDDVSGFSPEFIDSFPINEEGEVFIATGREASALIPQVNAVLIKNEVYEAYGKDVSTAQEYMDLLRFLKEQDPEQTPAAMSPSFYQRFYGYSAALAFMLPEVGQYSFATIFQNASMPVDVLYDTQTNTTMLPHESEHFVRALKDLAALREEELVDFWIIQSKPTFAKYPTLLVNTHDFINQTIYSAVPEYRNLDMAGYHLCLLYPDTQPILSLPSSENYTAVAYAMKNANTDEFMQFMNWLDTEENYQLFMNGHEGVDYHLESRQIIYEATDIAYSSWDQRRYFMRPYLETYLPSNLPSNFEEIVNAPLPFSYTIPLDGEEVQDLFREALEDEQFIEYRNAFYSDYLQLSDKLMGSVALPNVDSMIEDFINGQNESPSSTYIKDMFGRLNE
jgi:hypothetical protein